MATYEVQAEMVMYVTYAVEAESAQQAAERALAGRRAVVLETSGDEHVTDVRRVD
jgi:hypothetical protein